VSRLAIVLAIVLVLIAAAALAGCGVKGDPQLPEGTSDNFPGTYPENATPARRDNVFGSRRR
jgi:predicted small lipoprotein YifL